MSGLSLNTFRLRVTPHCVHAPRRSKLVQRMARSAAALALSAALMACGSAPLAPDTRAIELQALGPDTWWAQAAAQPPSPGNSGQISNLAAMNTQGGWVILNTGPSLAQGAAWRRALHDAGVQPVRAVLNTRAAPQAVLGNAAFADLPLHAPAPVAQAMRTDCPTCLAHQRQQVGAEIDGTRIVVPERLMVAAPGSDEVDACSTWGLQCLLLARSARASVLTVYSPRSGVLFAGALAVNTVVPDLRDTDARVWLASLARLRAAYPAAVVIPEQGPAGDPRLLDDTAGYLRDLIAAVREAQARGEPEGEAVSRIALPRYVGWQRYAELHPLNVQRVWRELEER